MHVRECFCAAIQALEEVRDGGPARQMLDVPKTRKIKIAPIPPALYHLTCHFAEWLQRHPGSLVIEALGKAYDTITQTPLRMPPELLSGDDGPPLAPLFHHSRMALGYVLEGLIDYQTYATLPSICVLPGPCTLVVPDDAINWNFRPSFDRWMWVVLADIRQWLMDGLGLWVSRFADDDVLHKGFWLLMAYMSRCNADRAVADLLHKLKAGSPMLLLKVLLAHYIKTMYVSLCSHLPSSNIMIQYRTWQREFSQVLWQPEEWILS